MKAACTILSIVILCSFTCSRKTEKPLAKDSPKTSIAADSTKNAAQTASPKLDTSRFIVSFYSIGAGTEGEQIGKFETFIEDFKKEKGKTVSYDKVHWGREGEADYCFPLTELTAQDQDDFIERTKDVLSKAKWVHFSENSPCRQKR